MIKKSNLLFRWIRYVGFGAFGLMAVVWLVDPKNPFDQSHQTSPPVIDAYMENTVAVRFTEQGLPKERMEAAFWQHSVANATTEMTLLHVDLYRPDGGLWHITADSGIGHHPDIGKAFEQVELSGHVDVARSHITTHDHLDWHLNTSVLVLTKTEASTHAPVTVFGPQSLIHAIGLKADLESGHVEFISQVRTEYQPQEIHI